MKTIIFGLGLALLMLVHSTVYPDDIKVLYITPDYQTGKVYDKIRTEISDGLREGLQEKWLREITNTTWERAPIKNQVLQRLKVNYVLKLGALPVIKETDKQVKIYFELMYVDAQFEPQGRTWNNAAYVVELNDAQDPNNIKDLVRDVCEEIEFYLNSSDDPEKRKFRPRIKIDGFKLANGETDKIDVVAFRQWLTEILEDKYSEDRSYIFYSSRKYVKQYPENSIYLISGSFKSYMPDQNLYQVLLTLEMPNAFDVDPVAISADKFESNPKQKKELVDRIATVMEKNVNYYGTE